MLSVPWQRELVPVGNAKSPWSDAPEVSTGWSRKEGPLK